MLWSKGSCSLPAERLLRLQASLDAPVPRRAVRASGTPGCAQGSGSSTGGHTWLRGRPSPAARSWAGGGSGSRCRLSARADASLATACAAAQLCRGAQRPPAPDEVVELSLLSSLLLTPFSLPTPLPVACAAPSRILPPQPHRIPGAAILISPQSILL